MTNAERIQYIKTRAEELHAEAESLYSKLPDNPLLDAERTELLYRGLKLKKESAIFTAEEREFFERIEEADEEARKILSDLYSEKAQLEKAEETDSMYATPIRVLPLSDLMEENASDTEIVTSAITDLMETRNLATGIGWDRYESLLKGNYDRITTEVRAIIKELKSVTLIETAAGLKITTPNALLIKYETEDYKAEAIRMLPEEPTIEVIEDTLAPLLYHHRKALEESGFSTSLMDTLIASKSKELAKAADISMDEEAFKSIYTTSVESYTFTKDLISTDLTTLKKNEQKALKQQLHEEGKKGKKEVTTFVTLGFDELSEENGLENLESLDFIEKELFNSITSVWVSAVNNGDIVDGEATTTLQALYRIMTKNPNSRLDPDKEKELADRLMKLNAANLSINAEEEFGAYPELKKQRARLERRSSLALISIDQATINGNTVYNAVHIIRLDRTPLYTYAKLKGHLASVPLKLLDTKARNKNNETIAIESYLISRIEAIGRITNEIKIDSLIEKVGIDPNDYKNFKKKRSDVCKKIDELLAGYVSTGYIKKYEFKSKGRVQKYKVVIYK